jgi:hypothetical protein
MVIGFRALTEECFIFQNAVDKRSCWIHSTTGLQAGIYGLSYDLQALGIPLEAAKFSH